VGTAVEAAEAPPGAAAAARAPCTPAEPCGWSAPAVPPRQPRWPPELRRDRGHRQIGSVLVKATGTRRCGQPSSTGGACDRVGPSAEPVPWRSTAPPIAEQLIRAWRHPPARVVSSASGPGRGRPSSSSGGPDDHAIARAPPASTPRGCCSRPADSSGRPERLDRRHHPRRRSTAFRRGRPAVAPQVVRAKIGRSRAGCWARNVG